MKIRTRFAPSPTGSLHIGNIRTALYSWLFARKKGGEFLLRIEDSDNRRVTKNAIDTIISGLTWLNLNWDKGPFFQTDRLERYNNVINYMIQNGIAYKCYCSSERLKLLRISQIKNGEKPKYDGYCRTLKRNIVENNNNYSMIASAPYVVRFCNPQKGTVKFHDQIRGVITFHNKELDDVIICRANGFPTYNFCVVVDDMDMNITHVIRGEEHISNTPRQINILKALNATIPIYAHVSMILGDDQKKLSKRHGALDIMQYRSNGFLPEAILNYLVRLGWSYGDQEIFSIDQMKRYFDFKNIGKSASIFNMKKLLWFNHYYINNLSIDNITSRVSWYVHENKINIEKGPRLVDVVKLFVKRSYTLKDIIDNFIVLHQDFDISKNIIAKDYLNDDAKVFLTLFKKQLISIISWTPQEIRAVIKNIFNELSFDMHWIGTLIRIVLIGKDRSPALNEVIYIIGKSRVLERIDRAMQICI